MRKISIGNDIIALAHTNTERTGKQKFYSKFLKPEEVTLFYKNFFSLSFEQYAWLCWSIKESVYKFQKRLQPELFFTPGKINVLKVQSPLKQLPPGGGNVMESDIIPVEHCYTSMALFDANEYYSCSIITKEFIYTITATEIIHNKIYWGLKKIEDVTYTNQSSEVRVFVLQKLNEIYPACKPEILKTTSGIPYIKEHLPILLSFTHHHNYIAYAFTAANTNKLIQHQSRQLLISPLSAVT